MSALNNDALPVPLLGWTSWNLLGLEVNETVVHEMANAMVASGLRDAGWNWLLLDDGWPRCGARDSTKGACVNNTGRGADGRLVADPQRFPSGMKAAADFAHGLGLKFGLYTSIGKLTCGLYEGSEGHEEVDAATFADWGIDFLKHDYCLSTVPKAMAHTAKMRDALNATGRRIVYYVDVGGMVPTTFGGALRPTTPREITASRPEQLPWAWAPGVAHLWKTWHDVGVNPDPQSYPLLCSWDKVLENLDHNTGHGQTLSSGPNSFNHPGAAETRPVARPPR